MGPAALILAAASLAGAIGGGHRKQIDPKWLEANFGPAAVSKEAMELFHNILNSPYGQNIMANAAEQGQQFSRNINRQAAESGLAGPNGTSGAGIFATSAAEGATNSLQRDAAGNFYQLALPTAQQMVQSRMSAYLNGLQNGGYETNSSRLWDKIGKAAGTVGAMLPGENSTSGPGSDVAMSPSGAYTPRIDTGVFEPSQPNPNLEGSDFRRMRLPNTSAMIPTFSKLRRFGSSNAVQAGGY